MCMIDGITAGIIEEVCETWMDQGRAFTGYEASKEVQARLEEKKLPFVRHREMRDYYHQDCNAIRDRISSGLYTMTQRPMGDGLQAFVFHPVNYDPTNYTPLPRDKGVGQLQPTVPSTNVAGAAPVAQAPLTNGNSISFTTSTNQPSTNGSRNTDPNIAEVNKSGELWIGVGHVQRAGFNAGDTVEVRQENGGVVLASVLGTGVKTKTVERYGNLRLYEQERVSLGLQSNRFNVVSTPGSITITDA